MEGTTLQSYPSRDSWLQVGFLMELLVTKSWSFAGLMCDVCAGRWEMER